MLCGTWGRKEIETLNINQFIIPTVESSDSPHHRLPIIFCMFEYLSLIKRLLTDVQNSCSVSGSDSGADSLGREAAEMTDAMLRVTGIIYPHSPSPCPQANAASCHPAPAVVPRGSARTAAPASTSWSGGSSASAHLAATRSPTARWPRATSPRTPFWPSRASASASTSPSLSRKHLRLRLTWVSFQWITLPSTPTSYPCMHAFNHPRLTFM